MLVDRAFSVRASSFCISTDLTAFEQPAQNLVTDMRFAPLIYHRDSRLHHTCSSNAKVSFILSIGKPLC